MKRVSNTRKRVLYYSEKGAILLGKGCYITRKRVLYYSEKGAIYQCKYMILKIKKCAKNQNKKYTK